VASPETYPAPTGPALRSRRVAGENGAAAPCRIRCSSTHGLCPGTGRSKAGPRFSGTPTAGRASLPCATFTRSGITIPGASVRSLARRIPRNRPRPDVDADGRDRARPRLHQLIRQWVDHDRTSGSRSRRRGLRVHVAKRRGSPRCESCLGQHAGATTSRGAPCIRFHPSVVDQNENKRAHTCTSRTAERPRSRARRPWLPIAALLACAAVSTKLLLAASTSGYR
jgi:hypothetical protein